MNLLKEETFFPVCPAWCETIAHARSSHAEMVCLGECLAILIVLSAKFQIWTILGKKDCSSPKHAKAITVASWFLSEQYQIRSQEIKYL